MSNSHFLGAIQKITAGGLPLDELLVAANGLEPDQARQLYEQLEADNTTDLRADIKVSGQ